MAPDDSSKKSGKELANASKWVKREISERALWGECQGSGKLPYQTQIDLKNIAFKCSCPSRKFPCKHGLGLLLLYSKDQKLFKNAAEPDWVTGWLDKRTEREEKKVEKKEPEKKADPAVQAKRQENRLKRVSDGMSELRLWIKDIVRNGLLNIPGKDAAWFEAMAKRMVDAQAPGLASMVRSLRDVNYYQDGWQTPFMDQLIRIYLVIEGFSRVDSFPEEFQLELKTLTGFTQNQDELKNEAGIRDQWFVLSKQTDKEEQLTTERNWLYGIDSKKFALVLQFYVRGQLPELNLMPGSCVDAELVYFKGVSSMRALVKEQFEVKTQQEVAGVNGWDETLHLMANTFAENPWIMEMPVIVDNVIPVKQDLKTWLLKDAHGKGVIIDDNFPFIWKLMAVSGGKPLRLFAIGSEHRFLPVGAWVNNQYTVFGS